MNKDDLLATYLTVYEDDHGTITEEMVDLYSGEEAKELLKRVWRALGVESTRQQDRLARANWMIDRLLKHIGDRGL